MALVLELTNSPIAVGGILTLRLLPAAIAGPLAARAALRWDRRRTMLAMDATRAVMIALVPLVRALWWVYLWGFLIEVASIVFLPARRRVHPRPRGERRRAAARQRADPRHVVREHPDRRRAVRGGGRAAVRDRPPAVRAGVLHRRADVPRLVLLHRPAHAAGEAARLGRRRRQRRRLPRRVPDPTGTRGHARGALGRARARRALLARHRVRARRPARVGLRVRCADRALRRRRGGGSVRTPAIARTATCWCAPASVSRTSAR